MTLGTPLKSWSASASFSTYIPYMEGAIDAMVSGEVDLEWAKEHHRAWVEEEQARTPDGPQLRKGAVPAE